MSENDQTQSSGQEQTRNETTRGERGERGERGGSSGSGGGGGRHGGRRRHQSQPSSSSQQSRRNDAASLNMRELRELVELFTSNGLTDFELENEDIRVRLSKNTGQGSGGGGHASGDAAPSMMTYTPGLAGISGGAASSNRESASASSGSSPAGATGGEGVAEHLHTITAPIVGTFYHAPSPGADAFVRVGSQVGLNTVVCIIEAMKLMNEILAETTGTVEKIYVDNGQPVEYGQPLFGIRK